MASFEYLVLPKYSLKFSFRDGDLAVNTQKTIESTQEELQNCKYYGIPNISESSYMKETLNMIKKDAPNIVIATLNYEQKYGFEMTDRIQFLYPPNFNRALFNVIVSL